MANLPTRNNNPGDLRPAGSNKGFQAFTSPMAGFEALKADIAGKISGNTKTGLGPKSTLVQFASTWAPAADNNKPLAYAQNLAKTLGVDVNHPIGQLSAHNLSLAVAKAEGYQGQLPTPESTPKGSLSLQQLQQMGAQPLKTPQNSSISATQLQQMGAVPLDQYNTQNNSSSNQGPKSFGAKVGDYLKGTATHLGDKLFGNSGDSLRAGELFTKIKKGQASADEKVEYGNLLKGQVSNTGGLVAGISNSEGNVTKDIAQKFLDIPANKSRTTAQWLMDKALGTPNKVIESGRSPASQMLKEQMIGGFQGMKNKAQSIINEVEPKIDQILKDSKRRVPISSMFRQMSDALKEGGATFSTQELKTIVKREVPKVRDFIDKNNISAPEANLVRKGLDKILSDRYFLTNSHPFNKEVVGNIANNLRSTIKDLHPETKPLFDRFAPAINAVKSTGKQLAKNLAIPFATFAAPTAFGAVTGHTKEGAAAGVALELLREGRKNPAILSLGANILHQLDNPQVATKLGKFTDVIRRGAFQGAAKAGSLLKGK